MEHPDVAAGYLIPDPKLDLSVFKMYERQRAGEKLSIEAMFRLSDSALRKERLLNAVLRLRPTYRTSMATAVQSAQVVRRSLHYGVATPRLARHVVRSILGAPQILRHFASSRSGRPPEVFGIDVMAEQAPTMASRVRLARRRDRLGVPMTILDWQLASIDWDSIRRTVEIFGDAVRKAGLGTVISTLGADKHQAAVFGNWHHLGTTRMHQDPAHGVVDENGRVHEMTNLYVAGGSVLPTGGYANPSLTIAALSLRLADHLKSTSTEAPGRRLAEDELRTRADVNPTSVADFGRRGHDRSLVAIFSLQLATRSGHTNDCVCVEGRAERSASFDVASAAKDGRSQAHS